MASSAASEEGGGTFRWAAPAPARRRPCGVSFALLAVVLSPALIILDQIIRELFLMSVLIAVGWLGSDWVKGVVSCNFGCYYCACIACVLPWSMVLLLLYQ